MTAPFAFSFSAVIIMMAKFHIPFDQAMALFTALSINAASDFGIYPIGDCHDSLLKGIGTSESIKEAFFINGKAVLIDALLNSIVFAPLVISHFRPVALLGGVMVGMLGTCCFAALVILPSIMPWCIKREENYNAI